jgi:predicted molibdopterin-dependent oxidoreductase YjgC
MEAVVAPVEAPATPVLEENIFSTICPGCSVGCGLYIRESDKLRVDFRKSSPVNAGKLCKFAMRLPEYYTQAKSRVDGKEVSMEEAINEASKRLSAYKGKTAFISIGNTTLEEHLAFKKLAEALEGKVDHGMFVFREKEPVPPTNIQASYDDVIKAKNLILILVDPYVQYPLLLRPILKAKEKGAKIVSVGWNKPRNLADKTVLLNPAEYLKQIQNLDTELKEYFQEALIISELHPLVDGELVKTICNLASKTESKILLAKAFVNSTGALLFDGEQKGIRKILWDISKGRYKALYLLDSDLLEIMPDEEEVATSLKPLELLIVQESRESKIGKRANIVIGSDPLYKKKGIVINMEGRVQENSGQEIKGIQALGNICKGVGGDALDFEALRSEALKKIGINQVNEFMLPSYETKKCEALYEVDAFVIHDAVKSSLVLAYNPFLWHNMKDPEYVQLSLNTINNLKIGKGGLVRLSSDRGSTRTRFKMGDILDKTILSYSKLPILSNWTITPIEVSR